MRRTPGTDTARWQSVLRRAGEHDGAFVFAVRTTGIYCRPSCPARRPRRENVTFYADAATAEQAGFRACRRCRPQAALAPGLLTVQRVCRYLETHRDQPVTLTRLAAHVGLSPFHLQRSFKATLGLSPRQYAAACRARAFRAALQRGRPVTEAVYAAGFGSPGAVRHPEQALGMAPGQLRRGGERQTVYFATARCSLGSLLVAATDIGVCAVELGSTREEVQARLRERLTRATLVHDPKRLAAWIGALRLSLAGATPPPQLPLDVQATAFQWRVWRELQSIARGTTRSYAEVARALGSPAAVRAVAGACARNPVALLIPCHRVVRSDGALGGYRWGLERKQKLLAAERRP